MSSSSPAALPVLALGLALALPLVGGCGHKANPKPPPQKIPQPIRDLVATQRGNELLFTFSYPQTTISGLPIDDIAAIELWEFEMAVPDLAPPADDQDDQAEEEPGEASESGDEGDDQPGEAVDGDEGEPAAAAEVEDQERALRGVTGPAGIADEGWPDDEAAAGDEGDGDTGDEAEDEAEDRPATGKEALLEVDPREFAAAGKRRLRLEGEELSSAISGDRVQLRVTLDKIDPEEKVGLVYGVRSFQTLDRVSAFSNLFKIVPRLTPEPPAELVLEPVRNGVKISWTYDGDEPKEFRFYRQDELTPAFDQHFGTQSGDSDQFLDASAEFGKTYTYAMSVVVNRTPLVESVFTPEREIEYLDVFAPEAPTDLVVLSEAGTARLLWEGSPDRDLAGYVVFRRSGAGQFERLNERPVREAEYSDTKAGSGRVVAYRVVALDRAGNMSDPSEEVEVRIP